MKAAAGGQGGETSATLDALARALGVALSVPLVLISLATPRDQEVVGEYLSERRGAQRHFGPAPALCRQVVRGAKPVVVHDVRRRIAPEGDALSGLGIAGYAGMPILVRGSAVGAVTILERGVRAWSARDVEVLRQFAEAVACVVAAEDARQRELEVATLLLSIAAAASATDVLEAIARHLGWPRAELMRVDAGRVRTFAAYDGDRSATRRVEAPRSADADAVVRDALRSGHAIWHTGGAARAHLPAFAIAIPGSSAVLALFAGDVSDPRDLEPIATAVTALVSAALHRMEPDASRDRRTGELEVLALHDELTGLLNRRGFYAVAGGQLAIAHRTGLPGMVLFIDVDGLKHVNDSEGHSAGDSLLQLAGRVLRATFGDSDTIARIGGDEFVVFSIDAIDQDVEEVADRLTSELARANETTGALSQLRWSVGHVCFDGAAVDSLDRLIAEADRRMYDIKRTTRLASIGFATT